MRLVSLGRGDVGKKIGIIASLARQDIGKVRVTLVGERIYRVIARFRQTAILAPARAEQHADNRDHQP